LTEIGHHMKVLAGWLVCLSMLTGFVVMLPEGADAAPPEGIIAGNMNDGTNPLPDSMIVVMMMFADGKIEQFTVTDADGNYSLSVPGGLDYMIMALNDSCYAESSSTRVMAGETSYVNFTMANIAPAVTDVTLMGLVTDELGDPVTSGQLGGYSNAIGGDGMPMFINMTSIDPSGYYTVNVLPSPEGCGVAALNMPGYPMADNKTDGATYSGQTYWVNLSLEPEVNTEDATIYGTVVDIDSGLPIQDVFVSIRTWNESSEQDDSNYTWTDSNGQYFMNITSGQGEITMTKPGYTVYRQDDLYISPGDNFVDGALRVTTATVMGNVTDASTSLPISSARVFLYDSTFTTMNMAVTNASGAYVLEAFDGTDLLLGAQAEGYSQSIMYVDINVSDVLWVDFELRSVDAWCVGNVTDTITGDPLQNVWLEFSSAEFYDDTNTDMSGAYNISLISGDYTVDANAPDHMNTMIDVTISPGENVLDIQLMPWNIPETVRLWGYVNDSLSGAGIPGATVDIGTGPPDYMERNQTMSMGDGYYEMMVPPVELITLAHANSHMHSEAIVDASSVSEVRQDFLLDQDVWSPNVTYSQNPIENVSWTNPSMIHAVAQELDMREMALFQFLSNGSGSGWTYYYAVETLYNSFNPLENQPNNLPYWMDGDNYTIDYGWVAMPGGGWLQGSAGDIYLQYYNIWWGPDQYSALRASYVNSSMGSPEFGTAWFDGATGQFAFFSFDYGGMPQVTPADPTGVISPYGMSIAVEDGTGMMMWYGTVSMGDWSVSGLEFWPQWEGPSGDYATLMFFNDWGDHGWGNIQLFTVDNELPVADAGPDQQVTVDTQVTFDGTMSSDNVGIVEYTWSFVDGVPVVLTGSVVDYNFTTSGNHTVELVVRDGAGHLTNDTMVVEVLGDGAPVADAGPDQEVPEDTVVYFDGTGSTDDVGIANYTWTIVELSLEMYGPMPEYTFSAPGVYNVVLVVTDTIGHSSAPDGMFVTVNDATPPTADAGGDQTMMGGELVTLDGTGSSDDVGVVNWTWTFMYEGSPVELWGPVVDFTFWVEGVYDITLNVTDAAGNWATDEVQITISGMIPEFPALVLPVTGVLFVLLYVRARKTRK